MTTLKQHKGLLAPLALLLALALVGAIIATLAISVEAAPGPASGNGVQPEEFTGNPTCSDLLNPEDFLFEFKFEPVQDATDIPLSFNGLSGTLDIDVRDTDQGQVFDFTLEGDFVAAGVFVKGGPGGNLYDYRPDGEDADTGLHAPINPNNNRFYGLSHISFCLAEARAELEVVKTASQEEVSPGQDLGFTIEVTNLGPAAAQNVTIDDTLPAGFTWTEDPDTTECEISGGNVLHCDVGDLAPGGSFSVTVTAPTDADPALCDDVLENVAVANADNADEVSDDASITFICGAIQVVKTAKHAADPSGFIPLAGAQFTIDGNVVETDADGLACVDNLPFGDYTVAETGVPAGYAGDPAGPKTVTVDNQASCADDPFGGESVPFVNTPLTDVQISIDSQVEGGTSTTIVCSDADGNEIATFTTDPTTGDGTLSIGDLPPQVLTCVINLDP